MSQDSATAGDGVQVCRVLADEAFEQGGQNFDFTDPGNDMGVEFLRFLAVADVENLVGPGLFDDGLARFTGGVGEEQHSGRDGRQDEAAVENEMKHG